MTVILNASTTQGLVLTSDTSGNVVIQSNGTNVISTSGSNVTIAGTLTATGGVLLGASAAPAFSAYPSVQQTGLTQSADTRVVLGTKEYDTGGCFNNTASNVTLNGITVPAYSFAPNVAGYYLITGTIWASLSGAINKGITNIYKNGTLYTNGNFAYSSSNVNEVGSTNTTILYLNGTSDYVTMYSYAETTGATYSLQNLPLQRVRFSGCMVRSA